MVDLPRRPARILLELDLTDVPADPDPDDALARLRSRARPQLRPLLRALHEAAADPRVVGLVARVGNRLPWATMQELRLGVQAFGKPTIAWAETFAEAGGGMTAYVFATAFDEIWLQPGGELPLLGVAAETTFLRGTLDKLGVEPQFEQRGEYKSAADRIVRTEYTEAHREAVDRLAQSAYDTAVTAIAESRRIDPDRVRELVDTGPRTAVEAREVGLVDRLGYRDQVYAAARAQGGAGTQLLFADRWRPRRRPRVPTRRRGHVALVRAHGTIASGRSQRGPLGRQLGSDTLCAALRAAIEDEHARAVLLHIDSPGGSAVASETIWREVVRVRESGRPVIVSMATLAGSGGYYIACPADEIVALPGTLTGSIGVLGGKFVVNDLLDRVGLGAGHVAYGRRARMYSPRSRFDEGERERFAAAVDTMYRDFVAKVADGRKRSYEQIEAVARGRVWTGADALDNGLVDRLGGLREAARVARERAGLPADAPVRPAVHLSPLARLGRPRSSEDPRAVVRTALVPDLSTVLGLPATSTMLMPSIALR